MSINPILLGGQTVTPSAPKKQSNKKQSQPGYVAVGGNIIPVNQPAQEKPKTLEQLFKESGGSSGTLIFRKSNIPSTDMFDTTDTTTKTTPNNIRISAFDKLRDRLSARGLGSLYEAVKNLIQEDLPDEEFTLQLRQTPAYKTRFAANDKRVAAGLRPLSEGEYINIEDAYQNLMKQYGLPESYWKPGDLGVQKSFENLIAGDVAATELEDRLQLGKDRVLNANPEIAAALRIYYPEITDGDILAYTLDPKNTINRLRRQVQAAEIGGAAAQAGFNAPGGAMPIVPGSRAEELAAAGVTGAEAKQGYQTIASFLPTATKLSDIYGQDAYTQKEAEQEVFGLAGMTTAREKRRRLASQERAKFGEQTGLAGTALEKGRAGAF